MAWKVPMPASRDVLLFTAALALGSTATAVAVVSTLSILTAQLQEDGSRRKNVSGEQESCPGNLSNHMCHCSSKKNVLQYMASSLLPSTVSGLATPSDAGSSAQSGPDPEVQKRACDQPHLMSPISGLVAVEDTTEMQPIPACFSHLRDGPNLLDSLRVSSATRLQYEDVSTMEPGVSLSPTNNVSLQEVSPVAKVNGRKVDPLDPRKRNGYLSWDDYFMAVAFLSAKRSKDPNRQVGACIVSQDRVILGIGYNGFPRGVSDNDLPWAKVAADGDPLKTKYPYVCHAEVNAVLNANQASLNGQRMYVTLFPCNECAKILIQAGIAEVIYFSGKGIGGSSAAVEPAYAASQRLLSLAGVKVWQHRPAGSIHLDFS